MKSQYRVFQSIIHKFESRSKLLSEHCTHSSGIDPPKKYIVYYSNYASGKNGVYFFFFWGRRRLTFERWDIDGADRNVLWQIAQELCKLYDNNKTLITAFLRAMK